MTRDIFDRPSTGEQCAQLWGDVYEASARWLCQERSHYEFESTMEHTTPCDCCVEMVLEVARDMEGLWVAYGRVAYTAGSDGLPEDEAAKGALHALIGQAQKLEMFMVGLAALDERGLWRLFREHVADLLEVLGSVAYSAGKEGVPEAEAAGRAVQAMAHRAQEIDAGVVAYPELGGLRWWRLSLEHPGSRARIVGRALRH